MYILLKRPFQILSIVLFVLAIFIGVSYFGKRSRDNTLLKPIIPPPDIPRFIDKKLPISLSISEENFSFPQELPLIEISKKTITESYASEIAKKLGFVEEIRKFNDSQVGIKYIWQGSEYSLAVTPGIGSLKYQFNQEIPTDIPSSNPEIHKDKVINFLTDMFNIPKNIINISDISFYIKSGDLLLKSQNIENAQMFRYHVTYNISDYRINTSYSDRSIITFDTLANGQIFSVEIFLFDTIVESKTQVNIKNYEETKQSIGDASFVGIEGLYTATKDIDTSSIGSVDVNKISLVYFYNEIETKKYLQPVFFLEGKIKFKDGAEYPAKLFLDAAKL